MSEYGALYTVEYKKKDRIRGNIINANIDKCDICKSNCLILAFDNSDWEYSSMKLCKRCIEGIFSKAVINQQGSKKETPINSNEQQ